MTTSKSVCFSLDHLKPEFESSIFYFLYFFQPQDDYSVLFEDTSYPDGYSPPLMVAQRYVILCKEDKKK